MNDEDKKELKKLGVRFPEANEIWIENSTSRQIFILKRINPIVYFRADNKLFALPEQQKEDQFILDYSPLEEIYSIKQCNKIKDLYDKIGKL